MRGALENLLERPQYRMDYEKSKQRQRPCGDSYCADTKCAYTTKR